MRQAGEQDKAASQADVVRASARAFEHDRYLSALLAPAGVRDDLTALAAFAGEIARIPGAVSQPMIGDIRLQWWRDTLDAATEAGEVAAGHPIADALAAALRRQKASLDTIHRVLDAQASRLEDRPFRDLDQLVAHLAAYDGGLFEAAWRMLGGRSTPPAVLAEAGVVYGLARCLIEAPAELAQGRVVLPTGLLESHGLPGHPGADGLAGEASRAPWRGVQSDIEAAVEALLRPLERSYQEADRLVRIAALPIALVRPYLKVSKRGEIVSLQALDAAPLTRVWRIWRTSRTGRL